MSDPLKVLVVDDDAAICRELGEALQHMGCTVSLAGRFDEVLPAVERFHPHAILIDVSLESYGEDERGLELVEEIRSRYPWMRFVVITAYASLAYNAGRYRLDGFIPKPLNMKKLEESIQLIRSHVNAESQRIDPDRHMDMDKLTLDLGARLRMPIFTRSPKYRQCLRDAVLFAQHDEMNLLITGETGSGKEVIARIIHETSPRRHRKLICRNISGLTHTLLESELFGHVRGAFTGANRDKKGILEEADGGSLFMDEIGDLPMDKQISLLRVLENRTFYSLGSNREITINIRFLSGTHCNLSEKIEKQEFRSDLMYRLSGVSIHVPPLRERPEDVLPMFRFFAGDQLRKEKLGTEVRILPSAEELIQQYPFPGNVRQLKNVANIAVIMSKSSTIHPEHFQRAIVLNEEGFKNHNTPPSCRQEQSERELLVRTLKKTGGNKTETARILGISRGTVYTRIRKYGIAQHQVIDVQKPV